jgi:hypothetical protein
MRHRDVVRVPRDALEQGKGALLEDDGAFVLTEIGMKRGEVAEAERELRVRGTLLALEDGACLLLRLDRVARLATPDEDPCEAVEGGSREPVRITEP